MAHKLLIPGLAALAAATTIGTAAVTMGVSNAQSATTSSSTNTTSTSQTTSAPDPSKGGHQANGKTETVLTGSDLTKATAAAQAKVSGATVVRAETDADGDGTYEVHMQKSDGSMVTVFLDSSFTVTSQTDGMSAKAPQPASNTSSTN